MRGGAVVGGEAAGAQVVAAVAAAVAAALHGRHLRKLMPLTSASKHTSTQRQ